MSTKIIQYQHDIASYAFKAVAEEVHEKEFAARAMESDRYDFSNGSYIIKIPHSQQELIRESQVLNHCVKVYIDRVREGETIIAFLRNADEPDTPLYTMEIRDGVIAQLRGFCNRTLNDAKMLSFVKKFAEEKDLYAFIQWLGKKSTSCKGGQAKSDSA